MLVSQAAASQLPALRQLCRVSLEHDPDAAELPVSLWGNPESASEHRLVVASRKEVMGAVFGSLRSTDRDGIGWVDLIAVAPQYRGRGIARELLAQLESSLTRAGAKELRLGGNGRCQAWPGVDVRYTPALCLAGSSGYQRHREAVTLTVDLARSDLEVPDDERALRAQGIQMHRLRQLEEDRFRRWAVTHFSEHWAWQALTALRRKPSGVHVAVRDGEYLGFACHGVTRPGWCGPLGVAEPVRGLGIGAVLLRRCLADQRLAGHRSVQMLAASSLQFYARAVGATVDRVFWSYRKQL